MQRCIIFYYLNFQTLLICLANDTILSLPPYTVTAYRYDDIPENIPSNITIINSNDIEKMGALTVVEVLEKEAGIHFRSLSGNASLSEIGMRGFGSNSGLRTLVIVDGQKLNRLDIGNFDWLQIPVSNIEKIEVLHGTQSVLYGNHAVGGVIKISTRIPDSNKGSISSILGSYGLNNLKLNYSGVQKKLRYDFSYNNNKIEGYRDRTGYKSKSATINFSYSLSDQLNLRVGTSYLDNFYELPGALPIIPGQALDRKSSLNTGLTAIEDNTDIKKNINLLLDFQINEQNRFEVVSAFSRRNFLWNIGNDHSQNIMDNIIFSPKYIFQNERSKIIFGIDENLDTLDLDRYNFEDLLGVAAIERNSIGSYIHVSHSMQEDWKISGGLRLEKSKIETRNFENTQPATPGSGILVENFNENKSDDGIAMNLGLVYNVSKNVRIWSRLDRLYRYAAADELASYQGGFLAVPFNQSLDPETGYSLEFGTEFKSNDSKINININLYATYLEGEIDFISGVTINGQQNLNINLPETRQLGVEFSTSYQTNFWSYHINYSGVQSIFIDGPFKGNDRFLVPNHKLNTQLEIIPWEKWLLRLEYIFTSEQFQGNDYNNTLGKLESYELVNLLVRYSPMKNLSLFASIDNIFAEEYSTVKVVDSIYPEPERTGRLGVTVNF